MEPLVAAGGFAPHRHTALTEGVACGGACGTSTFLLSQTSSDGDGGPGPRCPCLQRALGAQLHETAATHRVQHPRDGSGQQEVYCSSTSGPTAWQITLLGTSPSPILTRGPQSLPIHNSESFIPSLGHGDTAHITAHTCSPASVTRPSARVPIGPHQTTSVVTAFSGSRTPFRNGLIRRDSF